MHTTICIKFTIITWNIMETKPQRIQRMLSLIWSSRNKLGWYKSEHLLFLGGEENWLKKGIWQRHTATYWSDGKVLHSLFSGGYIWYWTVYLKSVSFICMLITPQFKNNNKNIIPLLTSIYTVCPLKPGKYKCCS